jgi:argininosuccinate lyase
LNHIQPIDEKILSAMSPLLLATELVDYLMHKGMPFREAHAVVGELVDYAHQRQKELNRLSLKEFQIFSDLFDKRVFDVLVFEKAVKRKKTYGSTHPKYVRIQIDEAKRFLNIHGCRRAKEP